MPLSLWNAMSVKHFRRRGVTSPFSHVLMRGPSCWYAATRTHRDTSSVNRSKISKRLGRCARVRPGSGERETYLEYNGMAGCVVTSGTNGNFGLDSIGLAVTNWDDQGSP